MPTRPSSASASCTTSSCSTGWHSFLSKPRVLPAAFYFRFGCASRLEIAVADKLPGALDQFIHLTGEPELQVVWMNGNAERHAGADGFGCLLLVPPGEECLPQGSVGFEAGEGKGGAPGLAGVDDSPCGFDDAIGQERPGLLPQRAERPGGGHVGGWRGKSVAGKPSSGSLH